MMDAGFVVFIVAIPAAAAGGIIIWFVRSRRRKQKEVQSDIDLGDEVKTVGGLKGTVVSFTKDEITMESGSKGSEIVIARDAVLSVTKENMRFGEKERE